MCKAHFRASQNECIDYQFVGEEAQVESVQDRVIPASLSWTPRSGGPMPLIAHLKDGMDAKKPPGWHRNEERRARRQPPVAQLMTDFEDWEIELLYSESLILTGTSQLSFKFLAFGWGREVGFHTELVKSVCASRRVMLPPFSRSTTISANHLRVVGHEVAGSTESTTSSHQSSRNSPSLPSQNKEEDTHGASSGASLEDESNWRRVQMQNQARMEQPISDLQRSSEDPRAAIAGMSSKLTASDYYMNYSSGKLEEVDETEEVDHTDYKMGKWGTSEEWMKDETDDNDQDAPMDPNGRTPSASLANMSSRLTGNDDWLQNNAGNDDWLQNQNNAVRLQPVDEFHAPVLRPGHHRGIDPTAKPPRKTSEDWIRGSIGQMDDLDNIEFSTYCLSMQFDEVTLQNIYQEPDQQSKQLG